ncbi:MAG: GAF and ANTAR domain-containing protein [Nocardioidaceae bacterium]
MADDRLTLRRNIDVAAREVTAPRTTQARLNDAVRAAAASVGHCDAAGITDVRRVGGRSRPETRAYTDEMALAGDLLQYALDDGPCLEALWEVPVIQSADLAQDERWPTWGARVSRETGARSLLAVRLLIHPGFLCALNLYSRSAGGFGQHDRDEAMALAVHIAETVAATHPVRGVGDADDPRTTIAHGCGVLMERHDLTSRQAFELLARLSAYGGTSVTDLARQLTQPRDGGADSETGPPGQRHP